MKSTFAFTVAILVALCLLGAAVADSNRDVASLLLRLLETKQTFDRFSPESDAIQADTRCVSVDSSLNVRNAPNGKIVGSVANKAKVTVYGLVNKAGTSWAKIGTNRYVSAKYLKSCASSTPKPTPKPTTPKNTLNTGSSSSSGSSKKGEEALSQIFKSEGRCQNWASDSGNKFQGKIGYTCMGVIPSECWNNRNGIFAPLLSGFNGHPADFCKYAYDKSQATYKKCAAELYEKKYFGPGGCNPLPQPAFYVCADIAVNSGVGRSQQYLKEFGGYKGQDAKSFARQLNERHRKDYLIWGAPGKKNHVFLKGWLARADERARYINNY